MQKIKYYSTIKIKELLTNGHQMDAFQDHYSKQKKPDQKKKKTKMYNLCMFIHVYEILEKTNLIYSDRKISDCVGMRVIYCEGTKRDLE